MAALRPAIRSAIRPAISPAYDYFAGVSSLALSLGFLAATVGSGTVDANDGSAVQSPTLTFARASTANYWNASGVLTSAASGYARAGSSNRRPVRQLLKNPGNLASATYWTGTYTTISSGQADPLGGTDAFNLIEAANTNYHSFLFPAANVIAGKTYTYSVYAKASGRSWIYFQANTTGFASAAYSHFDIENGVKGTLGSGATSAGIVAVGGGWYRCWVTMTAANTEAEDCRIYLCNTVNSVTSYLGDGASGVLLYMPNLTEGGIEDAIGVTNLVVAASASADTVLSAAPWSYKPGVTVSADTAVAPDGTTTADSLVEDASTGAHHVSGSLISNFTIGAPTVFSIFVKPVGRTWVLINTANDGSRGAWFNLSGAGSVGTQQASNTSASIVYWGNGWYRCSIGFTPSKTNPYPGVYAATADNVSSFAGSSSTAYYLWGAQVTLGTTVYPPMSMAHVGFTEQGYLAEAAATNLATDSEDFTAAAWTINNTDSLTVTANQSIFADGLTVMDEIKITDATNETHLISGSITISSATDYAISCFVRAGKVRYVGLNLYISSENFATTVFDTYAGTVATTDVGTTSGTVTDKGVIACGNGLYRVWMAARVTGTAAIIGLATYASAAPTFDASGLEAYAGTANDGFFSGGFQVETGTYPSSYVKTSGGTASRSADVGSFTGSDFSSWFKATGGTIVADMEPVQSISAATDRVKIWDGTANEVIAIVDDASANMDFDVTAGGVSQASIDSTMNASRATRRKQAAAFAADNFAHSANGLTAATDTSGSLPTVDRMTIGIGYYRSIQFYSTRKSDVDLATLSLITDDGLTWLQEQAA